MANHMNCLRGVSVLELFELLDLSTKFMAVEINDEIILEIHGGLICLIKMTRLN